MFIVAKPKVYENDLFVFLRENNYEIHIQVKLQQSSGHYLIGIFPTLALPTIIIYTMKYNPLTTISAL